MSKITTTPWSRRERSGPEVRFTDPAPVPDEPVDDWISMEVPCPDAGFDFFAAMQRQQHKRKKTSA